MSEDVPAYQSPRIPADSRDYVARNREMNEEISRMITLLEVAISRLAAVNATIGEEFRYLRCAVEKVEGDGLFIGVPTVTETGVAVTVSARLPRKTVDPALTLKARDEIDLAIRPVPR